MKEKIRELIKPKEEGDQERSIKLSWFVKVGQGGGGEGEGGGNIQN